MNYKELKDKVDYTVELPKGAIPIEMGIVAETSLKDAMMKGKRYIKVDCRNLCPVQCFADAKKKYSKAFSKYVSGDGFKAVGSPSEMAFIMDLEENLDKITG